MKETLDVSNHDLDELFEKYRTSPDSYVFVVLADACRKIGRVEEALEICDAGIKRHPKYASGHVVRGKCLYDLDRLAEAEESFEDVLGIDANNLVALKFLGMIEARAGRYEAARRHLKHILRLDPENREIKKAILDIDEQEQLERGATPERASDADGDEPELELDEAATDSDADELATTTLADIFAQQGYTEKALKIYREVLAKEPGNLAIQRKIAALTSDSEAVHEPPINLPYDGAVGDDDAAGFEEIEAEPDVEAEPDIEPEAEQSSRRTVESAKVEVPPTKSKKPKPDREKEDHPSEPANREINEEKNVAHFKQWLRGFRG